MRAKAATQPAAARRRWRRAGRAPGATGRKVRRSIQRRPPRGDSGLLPGLVWLFIGIALCIALGQVVGHDIGYFGLIPAGVGLAYLIHYFVEGRSRAASASKPTE